MWFKLILSAVISAKTSYLVITVSGGLESERADRIDDAFSWWRLNSAFLEVWEFLQHLSGPGAKNGILFC